MLNTSKQGDVLPSSFTLVNPKIDKIAAMLLYMFQNRQRAQLAIK
jgi:hypothetical protein